MTDMQLFEAMQYLDDALLEERPAPGQRRVWLRRGAAAACLLLAAGAALLALPQLCTLPIPTAQPTPVCSSPFPTAQIPASGADGIARPIQPGGVPGPGASESVPTPDALAWNDIDAARAAERTGADVAGVMMVSEPLTKAQLAACTPEIRLDWMDGFDGFAAYYLKDGAGGLAYIEMKVAHPGVGEYTVRLRDADTPEAPGCLCAVRETDHTSFYGGQEYRAYRLRYLHGEGDPAETPPEAWSEMQVVFEKEGVVYTLTAAVPEAQELCAAVDLKDLLLAYVGTHSVPDLSRFVCGEYLYRDDTLTLAEALADPDFGAYLPAEGPRGFEFDFARRYQFEEVTDYLMAVWTTGRASLQWLIQPIEEDNPDTPSIPFHALTEEAVEALTVTDCDGLPCCRVRVLYADVAVRVIARGVTTEWIYRALSRIN